ncbi:MAG: methionyl-tRNA formyltransferase [Oscillospiraceae bacterium]
MRIVFMGTPDFAVPSLQALLDNGHDVCGVFTQPDKPKGRGHKLCFTPIKELAIKSNIIVFQPPTLKSDDVFRQIELLNPDLIVVVAYGKILPKAILDFPKNKCINVHASLLPKYRGAGPIQWSVLNGEKKTGVSTMFMAQGIDTGDILLQSETLIGENETASELQSRLSVLGADLLIKTIKSLEKEELKPIAQNDSESSYAPILTKELCELDYNLTAQELHNKIRGLNEWPCATTTFMGSRLKIYKSEIVDISTDEKPGMLICNKTFVVACGKNTAIRFTLIQPEGSKRMTSQDYLRGKRPLINEMCGLK